MEIKEIKATKSSKHVSGKRVDRIRVAAYCRVSTNDADQLSSYDSQIKHYSNLINEKKEWHYVGIYADAAITGTQVTKRVDFQRLINDAVNDEIDMIITKSISRFARNTYDTLKYVRMLKEKGVAVFFEDENINTSTMDGELLLTILSSVAQQEVENISDNVKKGLKMKMKRGELVGFQGCLGYDYDKESKLLHINKEEAKIVEFIFERYVDGAGATIIEKELNKRGLKTKLGNNWAHGGVLRIIKNEKYVGDLLMGKTFTLDPISKRRLSNKGEEDKYYIKDHHEPIIDRGMYEKAHEILSKRSFARLPKGSNVTREKYSRKYAFSSMLECGFCTSSFSRRSWHGGNKYKKIIWQCVTNSKKGKEFCEHSKGIPESVIESAFIESYSMLVGRDRDLVNSFVKRVEDNTSLNKVEGKVKELNKKLENVASKKRTLLDLMLEGELEKNLMEGKMLKLTQDEQGLKKELEKDDVELKHAKELSMQVDEIRKVLNNDIKLIKFDRLIFERLIEKVIVGRIDENGKIDPYHLTFIYKTGIDNKVDAKKYKVDNRRKKSNVLPTNIGNDSGALSSNTSVDTCGDCCEA